MYAVNEDIYFNLSTLDIVLSNVQDIKMHLEYY